ncbi:hypothetical protein FKP32DRAFT_830179 [Trametes sanguinea]|nr:hypothetical protein FKP32DRAFT_830179 [Trametes sanguinea]
MAPRSRAWYITVMAALGLGAGALPAGCTLQLAHASCSVVVDSDRRCGVPEARRRRWSHEYKSRRGIGREGVLKSGKAIAGVTWRGLALIWSPVPGHSSATSTSLESILNFPAATSARRFSPRQPSIPTIHDGRLRHPAYADVHSTSSAF